jgi:hypothetical protein
VRVDPVLWGQGVTQTIQLSLLRKNTACLSKKIKELKRTGRPLIFYFNTWAWFLLRGSETAFLWEAGS